MTGAVALVPPPPAMRASSLAVGWRWRQRTGPDLAPQDMETRHLFFTLHMIWNNTMPAHMQVGTVRLYRFGPRHNPQYLREAIVQIGAELFTRSDMTRDWRRELNEMASWFDGVDPKRYIEDARQTSLMKRSPP